MPSVASGSKPGIRLCVRPGPGCSLEPPCCLRLIKNACKASEPLPDKSSCWSVSPVASQRGAGRLRSVILVAVGGVTMERLLTLLHRGTRAEMMEETLEFDNQSANILGPHSLYHAAASSCSWEAENVSRWPFYFGNGTCNINVTSSYPRTCTSTLFLPAAPRGKCSYWS